MLTKVTVIIISQFVCQAIMLRTSNSLYINYNYKTGVEWRNGLYYFHFADEATEAQSGYMMG